MGCCNFLDIISKKAGAKKVLHAKLNSYWLWREASRKLGLSNPSYKYWQEAKTLKLNNKYLFIAKDTLPPKYAHIQQKLTDLSGHLPTRYASNQLHTSDRIFSYEKMRLHREFEYKFVEDIKFVNLRKFFRENGIVVAKNSIIQLGKLSELELDASSQLYRLKDDYAVVVYSV